MQDDDDFLRTIPPFLRRYQEPPPRKLPIRPRDLPAAQSQSEPQPRPQPQPAATSAAAPAAAPTATPAPVASATPAPAAPAATAPAPTAPTATKEVETAQPLTAEGPAAQRARIALAFENQSLDPGPDQGAAQGAIQGTDAEDVAFQVILPRGVVRQIRMLAAEQDTTQRAVVLRALRLAGLSVPDGIDVDRRGRNARRHA